MNNEVILKSPSTQVLPGRGKRRRKTGVVVSDKMNKTIIVRVGRLTHHPVYKRFIKSSTKFKVHDEENKAKVGDKVKIVQTRPFSKDKRWRLVEIT